MNQKLFCLSIDGPLRDGYDAIAYAFTMLSVKHPDIAARLTFAEFEQVYRVCKPETESVRRQPR